MEHDIDILLIQETMVNQICKERRKHHTIYFSGTDSGNNHTEAGVAIMIKNTHLRNIHNINPIDDRLMSITMRGSLEYSFINTHLHTAEHTERNQPRYNALSQEFSNLNRKGPTYIGGDFNARIHESEGFDNELTVGPHLFDKNNPRLHLFDAGMTENRLLLLEFCITHDLRIANTWFQKPDQTLATIKHPNANIPENASRLWKHPLHDTVDYWLTPKRWSNNITDCETDPICKC